MARSCPAPGALHLAALAFFTVWMALAPPVSAQKHRKQKAPKATTEKDDKFTRIQLESGGLGWLYIPKGLPVTAEEAGKGTLPGLLVMLHGHGSKAKSMLSLSPLADEHHDYMLSVQGATELNTDRGVGYGWDIAVGAETIADLVRWVLANHPVDPAKVVVIGHSAGGTMALEAYPADPRLYAGLITVAAPRTPTSAHKKARVCVFLGTDDPNFNGAPAVRTALGGKRKWKTGCLVVLNGAEHNQLPNIHYLLTAVDWCLAEKARGAETMVPHEQPRAPIPTKDYRLVLVGYKGAENWNDPHATARKKSVARKLAASIARDAPKDKAYFPFEALAHSDHEGSFKIGGYVSLDELKEVDPKLAEAAEKLKPEEVCKPIEISRGYAVIRREKEEPKEGEETKK